MSLFLENIKFIKNIIKKILSIFNLQIVKKINKDNFPNETKKIVKNIINTCNKFSMTSKFRMWVLSEAIRYVKNKKIEGDFVECGVWKGGNIILFQKLNLLYDLKKKIYGFDTFEGMCEPGEFDKHKGISATKIAKSEGVQKISDWCNATIEEVLANINNNTEIKNIKLIKGKVQNTLLEKKNLPQKISILRLDTDWYSSTKIELEILYKLLVKNGVLILDDYGYWEGQKKATDEFFKKNNIWLHFVDEGCRYLIK